MFTEGNIPWNKGLKTQAHTQEWKDTVSARLMGRTSWNKGLKMSKEYCEKISLARLGNKNALGMKHTEMTKKRISEKRKNHQGAWLRKKLPEKTKQKISNTNKRKIFNETYRKNLSDSATGRKLSEETKNKIRKARLTQIIPYKDTKPEKMMQIALALRKIKFEKHKAVFGQPDIFIRPNICIFIDGDFWHANPKHYKMNDVILGEKTAQQIWAKDNAVTHRLSEQGYFVMRLWESTILNNTDQCAEKIINVLKNQIEVK